MAFAFACLVCIACADDKVKIQYQLTEVLNSEPWELDHPSHYRGDYVTENGTGSGSIHLVAYEQGGKILYDGCVITTDDIAVKPEINIFENLLYNSDKAAFSNGSVTIQPMRVQLEKDGEWLKGIVFNSTFFKVQK